VLDTSAAGGSGFDSIAVDLSGNVFVVANTSDAVYTYTNSLGAVTGSPWTSPTMSAPSSVIVDSSGSVYVADGGGNAGIIEKFSNSGSLITSIKNTCMNGVSSITLDTAGYLWADSFTNSAGCRISNPGGTSTFALSASLVEPNNIAIDSNGNGWVALQGDNYLAEITSTGGGALVGGPNDGGTSSPTWLAIDGAEHVWFANNGNSYALSEFNSSGTAITTSSGYQGGNLNTPSFLAIDASGDVWVPNKGANTVTQLIGAATPVVTPFAAEKPGIRP
jgi:streptogramin lyase